MLSVNTLLEKVNYKKIVTFLADVMATGFEDFAKDQKCFEETISLLENELKESVSPSVAEMMESIEQRIGSVVLFSYFLGIKANLDHFINPISRTFLEVDADTYLREDLLKQLPDYQNAQRIQEQFYAILSPAQRDRFEGIITYISHLETVGPKLAHYYGYISGNQLFPRIIPCYSTDTVLTLQYRNLLENYLGISIQ